MVEFIPASQHVYSVVLTDTYCVNVILGTINKEYETLDPDTYYFISDGTVIKAEELAVIVDKMKELNNA